jgi:hypothetical protein
MCPRNTLLLSLVAGLAFVLGCTQSAGPVQKLAIDPAAVKRLVLWGGGAFPVDDRVVIGRCVAELNRLAYEPCRPHIGVRCIEDLVLEDADGNRIAAFGFAPGRFTCVFLPTSEPFYVRWEAMPTIGRLMSFEQYTRARESLAKVASADRWDKKAMEQVAYDIISLCYTRPGLEPACPQSLEEVRALLQTLPEPRLDRLDEFIDRFR